MPGAADVWLASIKDTDQYYFVLSLQRRFRPLRTADDGTVARHGQAFAVGHTLTFQPSLHREPFGDFRRLVIHIYLHDIIIVTYYYVLSFAQTLYFAPRALRSQYRCEASEMELVPISEPMPDM